VDEYNYKESIENQIKVPFDNHWRKHTMSFIDGNKVGRLYF